MTPKRAKALRLLLENERSPLTAGRFAMLYYDEPTQQYLFTAVSNQGNGACAGKKAWLCAGSFLGKLCKEGLVDTVPFSNPRVFRITSKGRMALSRQEENINPR